MKELLNQENNDFDAVTQPRNVESKASQTDVASSVSSPAGNSSRPFKPRQFLFGLTLATSGMGLMLFVAAGALHDVGAGGAVSLPATGLCMILGLMMLGGGFGQMAISSPKFDDTEFQRLLSGAPRDPDDIENGGSPNVASNQVESTQPAADSSPQVSITQTQCEQPRNSKPMEARGTSVSAVFSDVVTS